MLMKFSRQMHDIINGKQVAIYRYSGVKSVLIDAKLE